MCNAFHGGMYHEPQNVNETNPGHECSGKACKLFIEVHRKRCRASHLAPLLSSKTDFTTAEGRYFMRGAEA